MPHLRPPLVLESFDSGPLARMLMTRFSPNVSDEPYLTAAGGGGGTAGTAGPLSTASLSQQYPPSSASQLLWSAPPQHMAWLDPQARGTPPTAGAAAAAAAAGHGRSSQRSARHSADAEAAATTAAMSGNHAAGVFSSVSVPPMLPPPLAAAAFGSAVGSLAGWAHAQEAEAAAEAAAEGNLSRRSTAEHSTSALAALHQLVACRGGSVEAGVGEGPDLWGSAQKLGTTQGAGAGRQAHSLDSGGGGGGRWLRRDLSGGSSLAEGAGLALSPTPSLQMQRRGSAAGGVPTASSAAGAAPHSAGFIGGGGGSGGGGGGSMGTLSPATSAEGVKARTGPRGVTFVEQPVESHHHHYAKPSFDEGEGQAGASGQHVGERGQSVGPGGGQLAAGMHGASFPGGVLPPGMGVGAAEAEWLGDDAIAEGEEEGMVEEEEVRWGEGGDYGEDEKVRCGGEGGEVVSMEEEEDVRWGGEEVDCWCRGNGKERGNKEEALLV